MHLELGMPEDFDISIEFKNWLFALEGTEEIRKSWCLSNGEDFSREERSWHTTFDNLKMKAKSNHTNRLLKTWQTRRMGNRSLELVMIGIEGLQALKPRSRSNASEPGSKSIKAHNNSRNFGAIDDNGGVNIEAHLILSERENAEEAKWDVENIRFSVKQPIEGVVTKEELEHLSVLCRSEVDSMCRIAAGILRLLKLEESIGQATIDQLSLGSKSLDKIFTPEKLGRRRSSINIVPTSNGVGGSPTVDMNSAVASLETEVRESHEKCSALISALSGSDCSEHAAEVEQLSRKLETMQTLLTRIRSICINS